MSKSQLQHYVPKFLLRRFGTGKKGHLHVLDKHTGKTFSKAASKVAAENSFYDFEFQGSRLTLEPSLAVLESRAAKHIERIVRDRCLHVLEVQERSELSQFLAVQMVRTRAHIETWKDVSSRMEVWLRERGVREEFFASSAKLGEHENAERAMFVRRISDAPKDFGSTSAAKDWVLLQTERKTPYFIGDHPLTMHNMTDRVGRGNLGLSVEGIEIYFPLSPELGLALWCPSHRGVLLEGIQRLTRISDSQPLVAARFSGVWTGAMNIMDAITTGTPLRSRPENVEFFNSLQVLSAERFVFSADGDFSLAEDMIRGDSGIRRGRRFTIG